MHILYVPIGRSNDLSKFVKHGAEGQESFAEVDILASDRLIKTIRRVINSENKGSKWFLDGKPAKQADVKALVSGLSIDVDNLCSFMPQDKVGSFSRFTPKEILSNTLRSIQDPQQEYSLSDEQRILSEIQDAKEEYRRKRDAKQTTLDTNKRELESMRSEMDRMQRREEKLKLLSDYEVRMLAVEIGELQEKCEEKQLVVDEKAAKIQEEKRRLAPLEEQERSLRRQQAARERAAEETTKMQGKIEDSLRRKKDAADLLEVEVDTAGNALILCTKLRATREKKRRDTENQLLQYQEEERVAKELLPALQAKADSIRSELNKLTEDRSDLDENVKLLTSECGKLRDEISATKRDINSLQDFKQRFRARMQSNNDSIVSEAMRAAEWLDNNHERLLQTGQLRSKVLGPVALHCSVSDPACAVMIEKAIPISKLMGFVADNEADARFIKSHFRTQMNLHINVFTIMNLAVDSRRSYPDELIAGIGLNGYLSDQIECPEVVRALFYSFHSFHRILWGRGADNLTSEQQVRLCQVDGGFKLYLHDVTSASQSAGRGKSGPNVVEYKGTRSRNPHAPPSTSSVGVVSRGILMSKTGDEDTVERRVSLQRTLTDTEHRLRQAEGTLSERKNSLRMLHEKLQAKRTELAEVVNASKTHATMQKRVEHFAKALADLDQELSVSTEVEKREKEEKYISAIHDLMKAIKDTVFLAHKSNNHRIDREVAVKLKDELVNSIRDATAELQEARRGIQDLNRELAHAERERDDNKKKSENKEAELNLKIEQSGLEPEEFAQQIYVQIVQRCPEATVAAISARIEQLNDEINRIADNPQLQRRFETVTKDVQRMERELQDAEQEFASAEDSLHKRAERWQKIVNNTTEKLNAKFSSYMQDLQLGGEVKLKATGKFDDYELQVRVRFRESSELSELDGNKHSGGERAVSTVMFLMALQDMTTSPFRVVDEINQGMDESNERLVFDRVVKSCCGDASKPQYFLVTPKLLQGLGAMRNDDVTVLLVWNGPGTTTKWEFADILAHLSQNTLGATTPTGTANSTAIKRELAAFQSAGNKRSRSEMT